MLGDTKTLQRILVHVIEDILPKNDSDLDAVQYSISGSQTGLQFTSALFGLGGLILLSKILIMGLIYTWWKLQNIKTGKHKSEPSSTDEERLYVGDRYEELIFLNDSEHISDPYYINYTSRGQHNQAPWQE
ncbi:uncharacterized protein PAF06_005005 [Gastrophryne carolinensis]